MQHAIGTAAKKPKRKYAVKITLKKLDISS